MWCANPGNIRLLALHKGFHCLDENAECPLALQATSWYASGQSFAAGEMLGDLIADAGSLVLIGGGTIKAGASLTKLAVKGVSPRVALAAEGHRTVTSVVDDLRTGKMTAADVPIDYIIRDNNVLILNTRSAAALERAGIPRSEWTAKNRTGVPDMDS